MTGPKFAKRVRAMVVANAVREPIAKVQDGLPPRAKASSCEATITTAHVTHIGLCVQIGCKTTATVKRPIVIELREMGNYALTCAFSARGCGIPLLSYFPGSIKMSTNRRSVLAGAVALAAVPLVTAMAQSSAQAETEARTPTPAMPDISGVRTAKEFAAGVIGPAELSLASSKIAVERATNPMVKEFAGFELTEAIAVTTVLKELGTTVPAPDAMAKATLAKIRDAHEGATFDRDYITAQVENHKFLRALATAYLKNAPKETARWRSYKGSISPHWRWPPLRSTFCSRNASWTICGRNRHSGGETNRRRYQLSSVLHRFYLLQ